jgi:hypothetical protein
MLLLLLLLLLQSLSARHTDKTINKEKTTAGKLSAYAVPKYI